VRPDGAGTIIFGNRSSMGYCCDSAGMTLFGWRYGDTAMAFYDIRNADSVYDLVSRLMNKESAENHDADGIQSDAQDKLRQDLLNGEEILWTGQPDPSVLFTQEDIFLVPFSLLWGGFAICIAGLVVYTAFRHPENVHYSNYSWIAWPILSIFIAFGLYMIFGRFIYKRYKKRHTYYAVTNKRVLVLTEVRRSDLRAVRFCGIPVLNKDIRSSGTGNIVFGRKLPFGMAYDNTGMELFGRRYPNPALAFYDIKDADHVYKLVDRLMKEAS
jgi:hypothetical protein